MGALAGRERRHRARLAGAAAVALAAAVLAAPADAARRQVAWKSGGGIAGITGGLVVYAERSVVADYDGRAAEFRLTHGEWSALRKRLRAARFGSLARRYAPDPIVPDSTYDEVRHRGRTVTVWTGGDPPRRLERLLEHLRRLHDRHRPAR